MLFLFDFFFVSLFCFVLFFILMCVEMHQYAEISSLWCSRNRWQCTKLHQTCCGYSSISISSSKCYKWANKREWSKTQETRWQMSNQNRYGCVLLLLFILYCVCVCVCAVLYLLLYSKNTSLKIQCLFVTVEFREKKWQMLCLKIAFHSLASVIDSIHEHEHPPQCIFFISVFIFLFSKLSPFLYSYLFVKITVNVMYCSFFFKKNKSSMYIQLCLVKRFPIFQRCHCCFCCFFL